MKIRSLVLDELAAARALLEAAGLAGANANLARYLQWQPTCGWVAVDADDALVGMVTVIRQGDAGFVGAMAVDPAHRGAGVGRRLLEHAHAVAAAAGITTLLLEATAMGERLYRRLGYVAEHETIIATRAPTIAAPAARTHGEPVDMRAIAALDHAATGVPRDDMLAGLLAEREPCATIVDGDARAALRAYGLIIGDRLGPVIARDAGAGAAVIDELVARSPACHVVTVPAPNAAALAVLERHGFREQRRLRRMRLGPAIAAAQPDWIWALASPGVG